MSHPSLNAMRDHFNPWPALPSKAPYVLECDATAICAFNKKAQEVHRLQLDAMPEPFVGSATAPVVLLGLNPGFDDRDPEVHARPEFQALLRKNYCQGKSAFPFYFLDPSFESPGRVWWERKLRWLLKEFGPKKLARSILCVEYFPYHSRRFNHKSLELPSQEFGFGLVRAAIARRALVVIMRSRKLWTKRVPRLKSYSRVFTLNSPQNIVVSPRNCRGFEVIVSAIRAKKDYA
jgi:hypothetical protein